jgi:hypothetical protein
MAKMTEAEADALDEFVTNNEITLGPNGSDWLTQRELRRLGLNHTALTWLNVQSKATHKSLAQIINEMVLEKAAPAG